MDTMNLGMREAGLFEVAKDAVQLEFERVGNEFKGLSESDVEECLKCLVACGRNSFVKEGAKIAMDPALRGSYAATRYPHFLKLEVLEMREKINNQKWKEL